VVLVKRLVDGTDLVQHSKYTFGYFKVGWKDLVSYFRINQNCIFLEKVTEFQTSIDRVFVFLLLVTSTYPSSQFLILVL